MIRSLSGRPFVSVADAASGDAVQVFLAVERVVVGPRPGRGRAADRFVMVEG
jgi:hypothetical protein